MTDREKLIARINASFEMQYSKRGLLTAQHTADDLISYGVTFAKDTNVPSWIPVTERLPEAGTNCLCFTGSTMQIAMYEGNYRWWTHYHSHTITGGNWFTHWMPLPEPPSGERRTDE